MINIVHLIRLWGISSRLCWFFYNCHYFWVLCSQTTEGGWRLFLKIECGVPQVTCRPERLPTHISIVDLAANTPSCPCDWFGFERDRLNVDIWMKRWICDDVLPRLHLGHNDHWCWLFVPVNWHRIWFVPVFSSDYQHQLSTDYQHQTPEYRKVARVGATVHSVIFVNKFINKWMVFLHTQSYILKISNILKIYTLGVEHDQLTRTQLTS